MSTPEASEVVERVLELMTAIDQVREIRLERARSAEEREQAVDDHAAVLRTVAALLDDLQAQGSEEARL